MLKHNELMNEDNQVEADIEQSDLSAGGRAFRRYSHITKQLLYDLYVSQGLSTVDLAKQLGVSRNTIWEYMEMYNIPRRSAGIAGAIATQVHKAREDVFTKVTDPDVAYMIGFIMGDGHIHDRGSARRLKIALAISDRQILDDMAAFVGDPQLVKEVAAQNEYEQAKAILTWGSSRICDDLIALGAPLGRKSGQEPFLSFTDDALTWSFIRGVSDADGSIRVYERAGLVKGKMYGPYQRARWSITIGTPFINGLHSFLSAQNIPLAPRCVQEKQGTGLLEISHQDSIRKLRDKMYAHGSLQLQRKALIFASL